MAFRHFPLDAALLLFDRDSGVNVLIDGPEMADLRQRAPRSVQFAITNKCNLACAFCSRDLDARSGWTADDAFDVLASLAKAGVLEVAFGGGEPFAFRDFEQLVRRLHDETPLAVHATTNGVLLTRSVVRVLARNLGELRLSLYDNNDWRQTLAMLAEEQMRFGVNLLVLPARLPALEALVLEIVALGCRDVLLLSYNGSDSSRHLSPMQVEDFARRVEVLRRALKRQCRISVSVCWGDRMAVVPRYLDRKDCGAGRDFLVITSDRRVMPCSFHDRSFPVHTADDILALWKSRAATLAMPAETAGCARLPHFGLGATP